MEQEHVSSSAQNVKEIQELWDVRLEQEISKIHNFDVSDNGLRPKLDVLWSKLEVLRARRDELVAKADELKALEDELQAKREAFRAKRNEFLAQRNEIAGQWELLYAEDESFRSLINPSNA